MFLTALIVGLLSVSFRPLCPGCFVYCYSIFEMVDLALWEERLKFYYIGGFDIHLISYPSLFYHFSLYFNLYTTHSSEFQCSPNPANTTFVFRRNEGFHLYIRRTIVNGVLFIKIVLLLNCIDLSRLFSVSCQKSGTYLFPCVSV